MQATAISPGKTINLLEHLLNQQYEGVPVISQSSDRLTFLKSSYSDGGNGCVEVGGHRERRVVRDSKDPEGPVFSLSRAAWSGLIDQVKGGGLDLR
ncbi:DUF397 domain-containing protein [Actinomadura hibisca]|uniref:DUF397 domain-containing protein n=1 Tax=Actinomadura hibisca TaxID=68565 RepID=UPI0009FEF8D7|nr:DUF397 domain-containing protein [Actinomadura hibisca]